MIKLCMLLGDESNLEYLRLLWRLTSLPLCYATSHNTFTVCKVEHFLRIRIRRHFAIIPDCKVAGLESMIK